VVTVTSYNDAFYRFLAVTSGASAHAVLPHLLDIIHPESVLDVGCGTGEWLKAFADAGVSDIQGVDGPWVNADALQIPRDCFRAVDLRVPIDLGRHFDLVVSLEVAEHIPHASADTFVDSLVRHGDIVLFSAAIPGQGGTFHVNEQWPEYWGKRFKARGYVGIDCVRPLVWEDPSVDYWYAQNVFLFVRDTTLASHATLQRESLRAGTELRALVHPRLWQARSTVIGAILANLNRVRDRLRRFRA